MTIRSQKFKFSKPQQNVEMKELWVVIDDIENAYSSIEEAISSIPAPTPPPPATEAFPIGSIFLSVDSTNPATTLGYGTWVAFAQGRMLVGVDPGDPDFAAVETTGGNKTHQIKCDELPSGCP